MKQSKEKPQVLLTVRKYAKLKDWSPQYVYDLIKTEKVKCVEISGVKFIDVADD